MKDLVAKELLKELLVMGQQITEYEPGRKQARKSLRFSQDLIQVLSKQAKKSWQRNQDLFQTLSKQTKKSEQHDQGLFQSLIDNSFDIIVIINSDGNIRYVSPSVEWTLGYEPEDWISKSPYYLIHQDDLKKLNSTFAEVLRRPDNVESIELRIRHKDGSWRTIECIGRNLIDHSSIAGIVCSINDITNWKNAEEAKQQSQERFQALIENAYEVIIILDYTGAAAYVSPSMKHTLGFEPEEIVGSGNLLERTHPDDILKVAERFVEGLANPGCTISMELRVQHKDGSWRNIETTGTNLLDHPSIGGFVCNLRDITDRKQAEQELQALYEREIKLRETLEEERRRRIEFTRVLVHELKTPLTPVLAASNLLIDEARDETLLKLSRSINKGALNLNNRIDYLLDIVKGEIGTLHLEFKSVDLLPLLQRVVDNIALMVSSNGHSLDLDLPQSLPLVWADENRLQQVVFNLICNASKFTPSGGMITLRAKKNGTALRVEVQDTGEGMSEEEQQRLFEPYYRVESDRQQLNGIGLGLAVCKTVIELHRGQIWVESRLGEGSTFGFSIPFEDN